MADGKVLGNSQEVFKLRTNFLIYLRRIVARIGLSDFEMQMILNLLITVHEVWYFLLLIFVLFILLLLENNVLFFELI